MKREQRGSKSVSKSSGKSSPGLASADGLLASGLLGKWFSDWWGIWQHRLMDHWQFSQYAKDRDVDFWKDHIAQMWGVGLLRADLVRSSFRLRQPGFVLLKQLENGEYLYTDARQPTYRRDGWGGSLKDVRLLPVWGKPWLARSKTIIPFFHPYRYYVLYHLARYLDFSIARAQLLIYPPGFVTMSSEHAERFSKLSSAPEFLASLSHWTAVAELAIAAEPCALPEMSGWASHQANETLAEYDERVAHYHRVLNVALVSIGQEKLERVREELCNCESRLDENRDIHTLLRLSMNSARLKAKGALGGGMLLREMAEAVRRVTERAFDVHLPEEDEIGWGAIFRSAKVKLYGSARLLDDGDARESFLKQLCFQSGRRVHWYVEGDTEYGGLEKAFGQNPGVVLINLRGQFAAKRGRGVGFQEDLANDVRTKIYSLVSFDGDVPNNLRALQKSLERKEFFGRVFVSRPDFEQANFSLQEISDVIRVIALDLGCSESEVASLGSSLLAGSSPEDLFARARRALPKQLGWLQKGMRWGGYLVRYALEHPMFPADQRESRKRPVVDAIEFAIRCLNSDYGQMSRENEVVSNHDSKGRLAAVILKQRMKA